MNKLITRPENEDGGSVTSLLAMAVEKNVPVEFLERLVALKERVDARDARAAFFNALSRFQDQCPEIPKLKHVNYVTKKGGRVNYSYAPIDQIAKAIRPALTANGLSYSFDVTLQDRIQNVICVLRHIDGHEERAAFPVPVESDAAMSEAQKMGAALTYGRRQSLVSVLGLTTADEDTDAAKGDLISDEKITDEQAANISDLIETSGSDKGRFLKWLGYESIADIPASEFKRAIEALKQKGGAQ